MQQWQRSLRQISDQEIDWSGHAVHFLESLSLSSSPKAKWLRAVKILHSFRETFFLQLHTSKWTRPLSKLFFISMEFWNPRCCQKCESNTLILMLNTWDLQDPFRLKIKAKKKKKSIWIILLKWLIIQNHSTIRIICFYRLHGRDAERQIWQANYRHACIGVIFSVWLCCALCSHTTWQKY